MVQVEHREQEQQNLQEERAQAHKRLQEMTEKLLLYGGALQQAGAVRQKAEQRATAGGERSAAEAGRRGETPGRLSKAPPTRLY